MTSVKILPPGPPEAMAFAMARYSRSADSIEKSLEWVFDHSQEKFWETFYFKYNHASIADLGHVSVCFEGISELAAQYLMDEQLWDGQAKSSRYQDFSSSGFFIPSDLDEEDASLYEDIITEQLCFYKAFHEKVLEELKNLPENEKPKDMSPTDYNRTMSARAFDIARYALPLAVKTSVGQVVSIRTLERQANRFLGSNIQELREIGEKIRVACDSIPEIYKPNGNDFSHKKIMDVQEPLARTLAKHIKPNTFEARYKDVVTRFMKLHFREFELEEANFRWHHNKNWPESLHSSGVDMISFNSHIEEIITGLLFTSCLHDVSTANFWAEKVIAKGLGEELIRLVLDERGSRDALPREFRSGHNINFSITCDIGAWRDLHRHRRCEQLWPDFHSSFGFNIPKPLKEELSSLREYYVGYMNQHFERIKRFKKDNPDTYSYLLPMGTLMNFMFKMDYAELEYISKLRSGVKGHFSYREVACKMKEEFARENEFLGGLINVTPLEKVDLLKR